jgi:hypothetical protein
MPANPSLQVDPDANGYTTAISDNNYVVMLIGPNRPSCITDAVAKRDLSFLDQGLRLSMRSRDGRRPAYRGGTDSHHRGQSAARYSSSGPAVSFQLAPQEAASPATLTDANASLQ